MDRSVEFFVSGRVQGVWFRDFTRRHAEALGVKGFVENLPDGRVHGVAQGDEAALATLFAHLEQGPPAAQVSGVERHDTSPAEHFSGFSVRR